MKDNKLFILFKTFFKIGAFTFGGGYSMIPFIEKEITEKHKFITSEEMMDIFSISECTPGPVSINCATFIGYKVNGFLGSFFSTLGVVLPSFIIILLISIFFSYFKTLSLVIKFLKGIKVGVILLLSSCVLKLNSKAKKSNFYYPIVILIISLSIFTNIGSILILFTSIIIYYVLSCLKRR